MKRALLVLAALLLPSAAAAQAVDSIPVIVDAPITQVVIGVQVGQSADFALDSIHGTVGDSIKFVAVALDEDGDTVAAVISWESTNQAVIDINPISGMAVLVGKGAAHIRVHAVRPSRYQMQVFRTIEGPGSAAEAVTTESVGETVQACAYLLDDDSRIAAMNDGTPGALCPEPWPHLDGTVYRRTVPQIQRFASDFEFVTADPDVVEIDPLTGLGVARSRGVTKLYVRGEDRWAPVGP